MSNLSTGKNMIQHICRIKFPIIIIILMFDVFVHVCMYVSVICVTVCSISVYMFVNWQDSCIISHRVIPHAGVSFSFSVWGIRTRCQVLSPIGYWSSDLHFYSLFMIQLQMYSFLQKSNSSGFFTRVSNFSAGTNFNMLFNTIKVRTFQG